MEQRVRAIPNPIIDDKELDRLDKIQKQYEKMMKPSVAGYVGGKVKDAIPDKVKDIAAGLKMTANESKVFEESMSLMGEGFHVLEKTAAKITVSEKEILKKASHLSPENPISDLSELCLLREYDLAKLANKYKTTDLGLALVEGSALGTAGFAGLPFNLLLSTFLFYRATQSIAMFYGYDVKNDPAELEIASSVFMNALSPKTANADEMSATITKVLAFAEISAVRQTARKSWEAMANREGLALLITRMRALAYKSAQKALQKAGKEGLEKSIFSEVYRQIGRKLTLKGTQTLGLAVGALIGGLTDVGQMNQVLEYADLFYRKRFIMEKAQRIGVLTGEIADVVIEETEV